MDNRRAMIVALVPVSARLDDWLTRYEYIDSRDPNVLPSLIELMNSIQQYVNSAYAQMGVSHPELEQISKEIFNGEPPTNNDKGSTRFGQDDLGERPPESTPQPV